MALLDLLRSAGLFNGLTDDQLERLIEIGEEVEFEENETIFQQGTDGNILYFIEEGQVEVLIRRKPHQPEQSQLFLGRGQVFGEMALLDMGKRSATVRCSQDGTVLHAISRQAFNELCNSDTAIGYIMMRNLALDLSFKLRHSNLKPGAEGP
ncbi:MAG: cyclic nucleotide-binding domain-containing protein [Chloroflexi bacterium]|nr:cyclic nucleotide-binding domain-containing protein [Chloroflexota bacterium]